MALPPDSKQHVREARADLRMFAWASLGPCLWFVALTGLSALGTHECKGGFIPTASWSVFGAGVLGHVAAIVALVRRSSEPSDSAPAREPERVRFVRWGAIALNVYSLLVLGGFGLPLLILGPCA